MSHTEFMAAYGLQFDVTKNGFITSKRMSRMLRDYRMFERLPENEVSVEYGGKATCIDLFPHHSHVVHLVTEFGFAPVRRLTRMVLSPASPRLPDPRVYGIAGFEFG
jgi:hypothetical protein